MSTTTTTPEISLRLTACEMPLVFLKRIPSKLQRALNALKDNDALEFTLNLERAARLQEQARSVLGNVADISHPDSDKTSYPLKEMIYKLLEDVKHTVYAVRTALGRDEAAEYFKVEESDSYMFRPHVITDKQSLEAVKSSLNDLVAVMRQRISARK